MTFLHQLDTLSDATRCRLLATLESQELTVGEVCSVLEVPQSTASRHLKHLCDSGWMQVRREGSRRFYRFELEPLAPRDRRLWLLLRNELEDLEQTLTADQSRLQKVLSERKLASASFFSASATEWDQLRAEIFGDRFDLQALLGLLDPTWVVADLGCGTGALSATLAPFVGRVVAIDASAEMLAAAGERTSGLDNVEVRAGDLESLPLEDESVDAAVLFLVLQYTASPWEVVTEAKRILRPGAPLLLVDLVAHDSEELRQRMGHLWQGFSAATVTKQLRRVGFENSHWVELPRASERTGRAKHSRSRKAPPALFSCTSRAPAARAEGSNRSHPLRLADSAGSREIKKA